MVCIWVHVQGLTSERGVTLEEFLLYVRRQLSGSIKSSLLLSGTEWLMTRSDRQSFGAYAFWVLIWLVDITQRWPTTICKPLITMVWMPLEIVNVGTTIIAFLLSNSIYSCRLKKIKSTKTYNLASQMLLSKTPDGNSFNWIFSKNLPTNNRERSLIHARLQDKLLSWLSISSSRNII